MNEIDPSHCPDLKFSLVRIFLQSDSIQSKYPYSVRILENTEESTKFEYVSRGEDWNIAKQPFSYVTQNRCS